MAHHDRRGRLARADNDPLRRPADGFRTRDRAQFVRLVHEAVRGLPADLRSHLADASLDIRDVPDPDVDIDADGQIRPIQVALAGPRGPAVLTVCRRPMELRAASRASLAAELSRGIATALHDALGLPPPEEG